MKNAITSFATFALALILTHNNAFAAPRGCESIENLEAAQKAIDESLLNLKGDNSLLEMTRAQSSKNLELIHELKALCGEPESESQAEPQAETQPESKPEPQPEPQPEPESAPQDVEARDIIIGSMMQEATGVTTCEMITVVAPRSKSLWARWTSNRDLSIASVSDLGGGATVSYEPIYNEAGFALGILGAKAVIQIREHGAFGPRVLYSGSKDDIKAKLETDGYVVGFSDVACHFNWRQADVKKRYEILVKARKSVNKS
jgi:hypothetical protein